MFATTTFEQEGHLHVAALNALQNQPFTSQRRFADTALPQGQFRSYIEERIGHHPSPPPPHW
jgi:hypothetical protein